MATTVGTLKSEAPISRRILLWVVALFGIFTVTGILLAFNYWVAILFFFTSLLILFRLGLEEYQWRSLWLLLITCLFLAVLVGSLALLFLSNDSRIAQLAQINALAGLFVGSNIRIILTSILIGLAAPLPLVIIPFLLVVAVATFGMLQWHKLDKGNSPSKTFWYVLFGLLGILHFSVTIEKEEIKGSEEELKRLINLGGPGWITIYPGQVVVLHKWGKITRVVGQGSVLLGREEQIKVIVPLGGKGESNTIENVLTRDRIPVKVIISHTVQVESAQEMRKRPLQEAVEEAKKELQRVTTGSSKGEIQTAQERLDQAEEFLKNFQNNKLESDIGDDYDQCDENVVKLVASKVGLKEASLTADIWGSMKGSIGGNLRDVIMSCGFEELFGISGDSNNLDENIQSRKIAEIEKIILDKAKGSGLSKGLVLRSVDISEIQFPQEIEGKIKTEVTALTEARIRDIEARTRELTAEVENRMIVKQTDAITTARLTEARAEHTASEVKARATVIRARGEAEAERLIAQARAEYFGYLAQILRQQNQSEETIKTVLQNLAATNSTIHYIRREQTGGTLPESSNEQN
ncbi:MAG: hypothetical protein HC875_05695 [Anaerolineales bacterium]|nr:hypothetical protein [Anaerolineales bacterium]